MNWIEAHLLTVAIFLPMAGALLIALLPRGEGGQHKGVALIVSLLTFAASLPLWSASAPRRSSPSSRGASGPPAWGSVTTWASTAWRCCSSC